MVSLGNLLGKVELFPGMNFTLQLKITIKFEDHCRFSK